MKKPDFSRRSQRQRDKALGNFRQSIIDQFDGKIDCSDLLDRYRGRDEIYDFVCLKHGVFKTHGYRVIPGPRQNIVPCPKCRQEKLEEQKARNIILRKERHKENKRNISDHLKLDMRMLEEEQKTLLFRKRMKIFFHDKPNLDFSKSIYKGVEVPVVVICKLHGPFEKTPHALGKGYNCPECGIMNRKKSIKISPKDMVKNIKKKHKGMITINPSPTTRIDDDIVATCKKHGDFKTRYNTLILSGCQKCYFERRALPFEEFVRKANHIHGGYYTYSPDGYTSSSRDVLCKCPNHGDFRQNAQDHLRGHGCPVCSESRGEKCIRGAFERWGVKFISQYKFPGSAYKYDFAIPDSKIMIEYDGEQHFMPVEIFGGEEAFKKQQETDKAKNDLAKENGWEILRFKYDVKLLLLQRKLKSQLKDLKITKESFKDDLYWHDFYHSNKLD